MSEAYARKKYVSTGEQSLRSGDGTSSLIRAPRLPNKLETTERGLDGPRRTFPLLRDVL